jgi:hypothetical protein
VDEAIGDTEAARTGDRVAKRDRPAVLEQDDRRGRVVRDVVDDVPRFFLGEDVDAVGSRLGAGLRPGFGALEAAGPETDERSDGRAELGRLVVAQVGALQDRDVALGVFVDREAVDHANRVVVLQPVELGQDFTLEVRLVEPQDQQLNGSDCHQISPFSLLSRIAPDDG